MVLGRGIGFGFEVGFNNIPNALLGDFMLRQDSTLLPILPGNFNTLVNEALN